MSDKMRIHLRMLRLQGVGLYQLRNAHDYSDDLRRAQWVIAHGSAKRGEGDE